MGFSYLFFTFLKTLRQISIANIKSMWGLLSLRLSGSMREDGEGYYIITAQKK